MWKIYKKGCSLSKPYPILLMHGLLDCSVSWFLHTDKYFFIDTDKKVYLTSLPHKDMKCGLATTEEIKYLTRKNAKMTIIGTIVWITWLTLTSLQLYKEFLKTRRRKSWSMLVTLKDQLSLFWEWEFINIFRIKLQDLLAWELLWPLITCKTTLSSNLLIS